MDRTFGMNIRNILLSLDGQIIKNGNNHKYIQIINEVFDLINETVLLAYSINIQDIKINLLLKDLTENIQLEEIISYSTTKLFEIMKLYMIRYHVAMDSLLISDDVNKTNSLFRDIVTLNNNMRNNLHNAFGDPLYNQDPKTYNHLNQEHEEIIISIYNNIIRIHDKKKIDYFYDACMIILNPDIINYNINEFDTEIFRLLGL